MPIRRLQTITRAAIAILLAYFSGIFSVQAQQKILLQHEQQPRPESTRNSKVGQLDAKVSLAYLAEPIINPLGGQTQTGGLLQGLWLQLKLGSGLRIPRTAWRELDHWNISTHAAIVRGDSDYYKQIGAAYPLQTMTASGQWLTEASLNREAGEGKLSLRAGIFTINPEFMQTGIFNYYVHSALNDTLNEEVIGIPIAPLAAPGIMVGYGDLNRSQAGLFKLGLFQIVSSNQFGISLHENSSPSALSGGVALLQWQKLLSGQRKSKGSHTSKIIGHADELPSPNLMVGAYWSQTKATGGIQPNSSGSIPQGQNRTIYGALTLPLSQSADGISKARLWFAGRVGLDWDNNPAPYFAGAGVVTQGLMRSRPNDVSGVAVVSTGFSPKLNPGLTQESVIEINHLIRITPKIGLKPFIQIILNPGGGGRYAPILAPGLQFSALL